MLPCLHACVIACVAAAVTGHAWCVHVLRGVANATPRLREGHKLSWDGLPIVPLVERHNDDSDLLGGRSKALHMMNVAELELLTGSPQKALEFVPVCRVSVPRMRPVTRVAALSAAAGRLRTRCGCGKRKRPQRRSAWDWRRSCV